MRNRELIQAYFRCSGLGLSTRQAVINAVKSPCSRFWITSERAKKRISAIVRGKENIRRAYPTRARMIKEIMSRCGGDYSTESIEGVVFSAAPEFYLTEKSAKLIIYREINKRRKKNRKP